MNITDPYHLVFMNHAASGGGGASGGGTVEGAFWAMVFCLAVAAFFAGLALWRDKSLLLLTAFCLFAATLPACSYFFPSVRQDSERTRNIGYKLERGKS